MPVYCSLHHENPDGSAFCDECGEPLASTAPDATVAASQPAPSAPAVAVGTQTCPSCGAQNPAGEAFCSNCGVSMLGGPAPAAVDANAVPAAAPAPAPA